MAEPKISQVQYQGSAQVRQMNPIQVPLGDPDLQRRLAAADQAFDAFETEGKAYYEQNQEQLQELTQFSQSLLNFAIERQTEENERALNRGILKFSRDKAAREAAILQYDQQDAELTERAGATQKAAMDAQRKGAPYEVVEGLSNLSGWERKGYAIQMAKSAGQSWTSYAMRHMRESDEEIQLPDGTSVKVNQPGKNPAQLAAVLGHLKEQWFSVSGMNGLSNNMLAKHALPGIDKADTSLLNAGRRQYAVQQTFEADQKAMNAFDENDAGSFHNLLHTFARGVDINGNPRGFVGAWKMVRSFLLEREAAGHEVDIEELKKLPVPGEKEGVTYGSKFSAKFDTLEREMRLERIHRSNFEDNEAALHDKNLEQQILQGLDEDSKEEDFILAQRYYLQNARSRNRQPSTAIEQFYKYNTIEGRELQAKLDRYKSLEDQGLLDPEMLLNEPAAVQNAYMQKAKQQKELRESTSNFKEIDKEVEGMVKAKAKDLSLPGEHYGSGTHLVIGELKQRIRKEALRLMAGDPNMTAAEAAMTASSRIMDEFKAAKDIEGHRYQLGIDSFDNFFSQSVDKDKAVAAAQKTKKMLEQVKADSSIIDKEGFLGDKAFFEKLEKDMKTPGHTIPSHLTYLSQQTGINVLELIDRGRRANGLPSLPGYNEAIDVIKNADPEFQTFLNELTAKRATRNRTQRYLRLSNSPYPVRSSMQYAVPPQSNVVQVSQAPGDKGKALNLLAKFESSGAGGYDAVNQYGEKGGTSTGADKGFYSGPFSQMKQHGGRKLTDLFLYEVLDLQYDDKSMTNEQWRDAGKLHAVGRYQFVGNTLPGLIKRAGLDPRTTKFTPEVQDRLALQLLSERGWRPWVGANKLSAQEKLFLESFIKR